MRVLLDTNVLLDHLLGRAPWAVDAAGIWQAVDDQRLDGFVAATTITNIFYITRRHAGLQVAHAAVRTCLSAFEIITVDHAVLTRAANLPGNDFEDNVQIICAITASLDAIITRDPQGFRVATVPVLSPADALAQLRQS